MTNPTPTSAARPMQGLAEWLRRIGDNFITEGGNQCGVEVADMLRWASEVEAVQAQPASAPTAPAQARMPQGWRFNSADASIPGRCCVMLKRDEAGTAQWHALSDVEKESQELYVSGLGTSLEEALADSIRVAHGISGDSSGAAPGVDQPDGAKR